MDILNCGHMPTPDGIAAGVAHYFGYSLCLPCADADQIAALLWEVDLVAYRSQDDREIITWPGAKLGTVTATWLSKPRWTRYGTARRRYVRVKDVHGQCWHGSGPEETGTYVRLHKSKASN